jgi:hypothetical protein
MKPDRSNYEIWVMDWLDGNLSDQRVDELKVFLNENPDLKDEIEGIALVNLKSGENPFPGKESLKRSADSLSQAQFEHLCIAYLENDLSHEQRSELLEIINNDENKIREFELTQKLKLKSPQYSYVWKKRIKKLTTGQKIIRLTVAGISTAAAIAALITVFLSSPSTTTKEEKQAMNFLKPDTLLIPLYPSITVKEKQGSLFGKMILPSKLKLTVPDLQLLEQNVFIAEEPKQYQSDSTNQIQRATAIIRVNVSSPENIIITNILDANMLLAYNKASILPSPFEDDRSNVDRFFARLFHEKIMKDKAGASPVKSYELAVAGITGLNKLFGWQIALHKTTDANGEVKSYYFSSKMLKFNAPVKKSSDSL